MLPGNDPESEEKLLRSVVGAFYDAYNKLGFGFFEHIYTAALEKELVKRGHRVGREVFVRIFYDGDVLATQRLDMVVDERLIVETKATQDLHPSARRQLYNYLRATNFRVGLLLHFGPIPWFWTVSNRAQTSDAVHASHAEDASISSF